MGTDIVAVCSPQTSNPSSQSRNIIMLFPCSVGAFVLPLWWRLTMWKRSPVETVTPWHYWCEHGHAFFVNGELCVHFVHFGTSTSSKGSWILGAAWHATTGRRQWLSPDQNRAKACGNTSGLPQPSRVQSSIQQTKGKNSNEKQMRGNHKQRLKRRNPKTYPLSIQRTEMSTIFWTQLKACGSTGMAFPELGRESIEHWI